MSRQMRRSGVSITFIMDMIGWKPDIVFQVGVGQYYKEVEVMQEAWPEVNFIGCEAHPRIANRLDKDYPGEIYECAVGNKIGKSTLYIKEKHKDGSSLYPHKVHQSNDVYNEVEVLCTTLDRLFPNPDKYGKDILLWIDCEGNELNTLEGGKNFLKSVQVVNVEMTSLPPSDGWCKPTEVHKWLMDNGFYRLWIHTQRSAAGQCDAVYVRPELFKSEVCCCPCEVTRHEQNHKG